MSFFYDPVTGEREQPPKHVFVWWKLLRKLESPASRVSSAIRRAEALRRKLLPTPEEYRLRLMNERAHKMCAKPDPFYPHRPSGYLEVTSDDLSSPEATMQ